jgi:hypothetical protein
LHASNVIGRLAWPTSASDWPRRRSSPPPSRPKCFLHGAVYGAGAVWRWPGYRRKLGALFRWVWRISIFGIAGSGRLEHHVGELLAYLERNQGTLVHYAARGRNGEPISPAFTESAINEIIAKRMNKRQQMRWNRAMVQPFLDVRTTVLNDTLEDTFRPRYPGFRPTNGDEVVALAT